MPEKLTPEPRYAVELTAEQVQALYLTLFHGRIGGKERPETRPAFGWIEQPLVDIERALAPLHSYLHDGQFNAMNRAFFGDSRLDLPSAAKPTLPLLPGAALAQAGHTGDVK